jgi:hypothetical protein
LPRSWRATRRGSRMKKPRSSGDIWLGSVDVGGLGMQRDLNRTGPVRFGLGCVFLAVVTLQGWSSKDVPGSKARFSCLVPILRIASCQRPPS